MPLRYVLIDVSLNRKSRSEPQSIFTECLCQRDIGCIPSSANQIPRNTECVVARIEDPPSVGQEDFHPGRETSL